MSSHTHVACTVLMQLMRLFRYTHACAHCDACATRAFAHPQTKMFELFEDVQKELKFASGEIEGSNRIPDGHKTSPARRHFVPEEEFADNSASSQRLPAFGSRPLTLSSAPLAGLEYRVKQCEQYHWKPDLRCVGLREKVQGFLFRLHLCLPGCLSASIRAPEERICSDKRSCRY
jgi:hypothetical protein